MKKIILFFVLTLVSIVFFGCTKSQEEEGTNTEKDTSNHYESQEETKQNVSINKDNGKAVFSNVKYNMGFEYPSEWKVEEVEENRKYKLLTKFDQDAYMDGRFEQSGWPGYTVEVDIIEGNFQEIIKNDKADGSIEIFDHKVISFDSQFEIIEGIFHGHTSPDLYYVNLGQITAKFHSFTDEEQIKDIVESIRTDLK